MQIEHNQCYLSWPTRSSNSELCVGRQRKVRTPSFVEIWREAFAGKTKAWGWLEFILSEAEGLALFSSHLPAQIPTGYLPLSFGEAKERKKIVEYDYDLLAITFI